MVERHPQPVTAPPTPGQRLADVVRSTGATGALMWRCLATGGLHATDAVGIPGPTLTGWGHLPPDAEQPPTRAARGDQPILLESTKDLDLRFPASTAAAAEAVALACLPIHRRGASPEVVGVLGLAFPRQRTFDEPVRARLQELADGLGDLVAAQPPVPGDVPLPRPTELAATTAALEVLVERAPLGMALLDGTLCFLRVNPRFALLDGVGVDAHLGRAFGAVVPRLAEAAEAQLRQTMESGEVMHQAEVETSASGADAGPRRWVLSGYPVRAPDGSTTLALILDDVTEHQRVEHLMRRGERDEAERDGLLRLTTALSPALSLHDVAGIVTTSLPDYVGAYSANLALMEDDRTTLRFVHIDRGFTDEAVRDWRTFDIHADAPVAEAARTRRAVFNRTVAEFVAGRPHLVEAARTARVASWASLPLVAGGRLLGVLGLTFAVEQAFTESEQAFLRTVAGACAQALERARMHELDHDVAVALQHALLPQRLPVVPGIELAARYQAGAEGVEVGGDWYDTWPTDGGRLAVALGDVMGRGAAAAAVMGQVRAATRAYVALSDSPVSVATSLDRLFADFEVADALVTLVYAVVDPARRTIELITLGHLPPVLAHAGSVSALPVEPGVPLGVQRAPERTSTTLSLPDRATLLMFTDGLVEHRERPVGDGIAELLSVVALASAAGEVAVAELCDVVIEAMLAGTPQDDDVALLVLRLGDDAASTA